MKNDHHNRPAIILWDVANALSIVRSLGTEGIECYAINYPQAPVKHSWFCKWIDMPKPKAPGTVEETWVAYLLGGELNYLPRYSAP